jgi:sugar phosphate isomerase/epimerase
MRLGFSPVTAQILDLDAAFALAQELGLAFVELSADVNEISPVLQEAERVRSLTAATGVAVTVHLSYIDLNLASLIPAARRTSLDRTLRGLEYAAAVDAGCGVLHSGLHYVRHSRIDPLVAEALHASLGELEGATVPIALENLALQPNDYLRGPAQLRELTRRHGMRNCVDFGHAHIEAARDAGATIAAYLDTLGEDVVHLHLHNNDGRSDEHRATQAGTIDFDPFRSYLTAFRGTICLEIASGEAGVRASVAHLRTLIARRA